MIELTRVHALVAGKGTLHTAQAHCDPLPLVFQPARDVGCMPAGLVCFQADPNCDWHVASTSAVWYAPGYATDTASHF